MTKKHWSLVKIISAVAGILAIWFTLSDRLDKRIENNPKMITMEVKLEEANRRLETAQKTLDEIFAELIKQKTYKGRSDK